MINQKLEITNTRYKRLTMPDIFISIMGIIVGGWRKEGLSKMAKVKIIYWSGTGNTETMADAVEVGAKGAGAEVDVLVANDFNSGKVAEYDGIAFGCPAMGAENLEESEFEPMFTEVEGSLSGKKIALFGSYGWGSGEWMADWEERSKAAGAVLATDSVICQEAPDDDAVENCKKLGAALA